MLYLLVSADFHTGPDGTTRTDIVMRQIKLSGIKCLKKEVIRM